MKRLRIAITLGDPGGIGPELVARVAAAPPPNVLPVIFGTQASLEEGCVRGAISSEEVMGLLHECDGPADVPIGIPSSAGGKCALSAIREATNAAKQGTVDALVTAPISKKSFSLAGESSPGHTGLLARIFDASQVNMVFIAESLRVALLTIHIPFREIALRITREKIYEGIVSFDRALKLEFNEPEVQIRVASLNPHMGEEGLLGREEIDVIRPAIEDAQLQGIDVVGPERNEGLFRRVRSGKPKAILALFHDQALAPLKGIAGLDMVNVTTGLPVVRTSPDHGTGFDIVGNGSASAASIRLAVEWAARLATSRRQTRQRSRSK
jgi:4-hydroxythreonine-4-phosphate dehydrogenase